MQLALTGALHVLFIGIAWRLSFRKSGHGYPVLEGCAAYMDCSVFEKHTAGDHTIFPCKVDEIEVYTKESSVYCSRYYAQLIPP